MNYDMVLNHLTTYTDDELFYKSYQEAKKNPQTLETFLNQLDIKQMKEKNLFLPEVKESTMPKSMRYNGFFTAKDHSKVCVIEKHSRYMPALAHNHSYFEAVYVLTGNCIHHIGSDVVCSNEGDFCLIAPDVSHTTEVFNESLVVHLFIKRSTFDDIFFNVIRDKGMLSGFFTANSAAAHHLDYILFHTDNDDQIKNHIFDIYLEQFNDDKYSSRMINSLLAIFFTRLMRLYKKTADIPPGAKQMDEQDIAMLSYIQDHFATISLVDVAQKFNFSSPYCSKLIKEISGATFSTLLRQIKMRRAEVYLTTTNDSISDISDNLGYENTETFIRIFKKEYHMTPGKYRQTYK